MCPVTLHETSSERVQPALLRGQEKAHNQDLGRYRRQPASPTAGGRTQRHSHFLSPRKAPRCSQTQGRDVGTALVQGPL